MKTIKVISYNIHGAKSPWRKRDTTLAIFDLLQKHDPDIIALQELCKHPEPKKINLDQLLLDFWPYFSFQENTVFTHYGLGNAVFSRYPIVERRSFLIGQSAREQRGLLEVTLELEKEKKVKIFCTHLGVVARDALEELAECLDLIGQSQGEGKFKQFIFCGDFNDWRVSLDRKIRNRLKCRELSEYLKIAPLKTFPTIRPLWALDRIYFSGPKLIEASTCTLPYGPSDHRLISATFCFT